MKTKTIIITGIIIIGFLLLGFRDKETEEEDEINLQALKFKYILEVAQKNYVDSLDIKKVSEAALAALVREIDPQSSYFTAEQLKIANESHKGSSHGIGVNLVSLSDSLYILSVVDNSPADSAGIETGDKILFINGENTYKMNTVDAQNILNGEKGTKVNIIVRRGFSSSLQEYSLERKEVPLPSIDAAFIIPGTKTGYILMNRFSDIADSEFAKSAELLIKKGMKQLILDLRNNPGGNLDCSAKIADEFFPNGKIVTYTKATNPEYRLEYKSSKKNQLLLNTPLVVLLNAQSASASEALAGSIQDFDRGLIVGEPSFGKATAQKLWNIKDGSGFSLTVAYYLTPSGRCIQKIPIRDEAMPKLDPALGLTSDSSIKNQLEEVMKKTGGKTQLPVFKTSKGRSVIGGGGIYPDYIVKSDTLTLLTKILQQRGIFVEYAFNYLNYDGKKIVSEYKNNMSEFVMKYKIDDTLLDDFVLFAKRKNVWNDIMFVTDKEYIRNFLKAVIAHDIWGNNGYSSVMLAQDAQMKRALEVMPEAEKMLK